MSTHSSARGFSLAELILSIGLFSLAVLALLGLSLSILRTDSKALERSAGTLIADQLLQRTLAQLRNDEPLGSRGAFFGGDHSKAPWSEGTIQNDQTEFSYKLYSRPVLDRATGAELSESSPGNRLRKVEIHVWWASEEGQARQGSGFLEVWTTRLVSEAEVTTDEEA